jgi:hypothetical protein
MDMALNKKSFMNFLVILLPFGIMSYITIVLIYCWVCRGMGI